MNDADAKMGKSVEATREEFAAIRAGVAFDDAHLAPVTDYDQRTNVRHERLRQTSRRGHEHQVKRLVEDE